MIAIGKSSSSIASHLGVFLLGVVLATAVSAKSAPSTSTVIAKRYAALDALAQSLSLIANSHVDEVNERKLIYGAIAGMTAELDPHSVFYSPSQYKRMQQDTQGEFGGIGVELGVGDAKSPYPTIASVIPNSPSARAGLLVGDSLMAVNKEKTLADGKLQASLSTWHSRIRGNSGTRVELTIRRQGSREARTMVLVRQRVAIPSVQSERYGDVTYIAIRRFREATVRDLRKALKSGLSGESPKLILDLRGNPGGLLDKGIAVADLFLDKGTIVSVESRAGRNQEVSHAHAANSYVGFPMVVLIDETSASASEIVAAALQDNKRATVVGETSFGKGSVQTFFDLADGSGLKLTTSRYLTPNGKTLEGSGIQPDILVDAFAAEIISVGSSSEAGASENALQQKELTQIQREAMDADLQLYKSYQQLRAVQ